MQQKHATAPPAATSSSVKVSAIFKIGIYGPSGAGKSVLGARMRTIGDSSTGPEPQRLPVVSTVSTIGSDFFLYEFVRNSKNFTLQIWDTGGQERFAAISNMYLRRCMAILVTFDLYDLYLHLCVNLTLTGDALRIALRDKCSLWIAATSADTVRSKNIAEMNGLFALTGGPIVAIVANKIDACAKLCTDEQLEPIRRAMRELASTHNAAYFETSALTGKGVRALVDWLLAAVYNAYCDNAPPALEPTPATKPVQLRRAVDHDSVQTESCGC
jgi:GTPase SAR1 family protein